MSRAEAKERFAIIPALIDGAHGKASVAEVHEIVAADLVFRPTLEVIPLDELLVEAEEPLTRSVAACGSEAACIAARLDRAGVALGLTVAINFDVAPPLASLLLVDARTKKARAESVTELRSLSLLGPLAAKLLDEAKVPRGGRLSITVSPADAELVLSSGDVPDKNSTRTFTLAPGHYQISAAKDGYLPAATSAVVTEGQLTQAAIALEAEPSFVGSPWFWAIIAGTAVTAATVTVIAVDPFSDEIGCLCVYPSGASCSCN